MDEINRRDPFASKPSTDLSDIAKLTPTPLASKPVRVADEQMAPDTSAHKSRRRYKEPRNVAIGLRLSSSEDDRLRKFCYDHDLSVPNAVVKWLTDSGY